MAEDTKLCSNCKRDISAANFVMHEMHCRRHIVLCEHCDEPIHRSEVEQHFSEVHAKIPCERCQKQIAKSNMEKHMADECTKKLMSCEFCDISVPKDELDSHLDYCGSRTEPCPLCQQYIMLKDMLRHENSGCTYPEPKPQPAPNSFSMDTLQQILNGADIGHQNSLRTQNRGSIKSDVNVQRARNLATQGLSEDLNSIPPDVDYDTMLALQLAHEDWLSDSNIDTDGAQENRNPLSDGGLGNMRDFGDFLGNSADEWSHLMSEHGPDRTTVGRHRQNNTDLDEDDMKIPCEFCEIEIPLSTYLEHTESCPIARLSIQNNTADLNNENTPSQLPSNRPAIPVINNLRSRGPSTGAEEFLGHDSSFGEDFMLPCEFCEDIFPSQLIIEHQSVCQPGGLHTPRANTPVTSSRTTSQSYQPSNPRAFKPSNRASKPKRQPDPAPIDFAGHHGMGDPDENMYRDLRSSRVESSTDKYSPAVNRFDDAIARPPRHTSRQHSEESDESQEVRRPSKSAQRARARLNQLLQDDLENGQDGAARSSDKQTSTLAGRDVNRADPSRKKQVDSRTVMRQLQETKQRQTAKSPTKASRAPGSENQTSPDSTSHATGSRNRRRADQLFSPELRLKPDHNPPPKKR